MKQNNNTLATRLTAPIPPFMLIEMSAKWPKITKRQLRAWLPLFIVLIAVSASFFYGWYGDSSTPQSGGDWADQSVYKATTERLQSGQLPTPSQTHYAIGYPLLGVLGSVLVPTDPFMIVSLGLILASATFCFLAVRHLFGVKWAVAFSVLLFWWDGHARTLNFSSEIFAVPWNNQVLFAAFAFLFWLFTVKLDKKVPTWRFVAVLGLIVGLTVATREESLLFMAPAAAIFLFLSKAGWQKWLVCFGVAFLCYIPQAAVKYTVLGSATKASNSRGYSQQLGRYLRPSRLYRNTLETIVNKDFFEKSTSNRKVLFQAAPWLWLSLIGIPLILFSGRYSAGVKVFVGLSLLLAAFYLSGANMSAHKLQFHCLRYISASFIMLNFASVSAAREIYLAVRRRLAAPPGETAAK